jgi:phosphate transport system substrate-binding protein
MKSRIFAHGLSFVVGVIVIFFALSVAANVGLAPPSAAHPDHVEATPGSNALTASAVVVVHPSNTLECLSIEQLHRLWRDGSTIDRWNGLDPNLSDDPIELHAPAPGSAAYEAFTAAVVGEEGAIRSDAKISQAEDETIESVATDERAVGFVSYASFSEMQRPLEAIAVDTGEGCVKPSPATIDDGSYIPALATGIADVT